MIKLTSRKLCQENSERASGVCLSFSVSYFNHPLTFLALKEQCFVPSMERPPSFKPPPPPIKYTCIQESIGNDLPCHEMEAL